MIIMSKLLPSGFQCLMLKFTLMVATFQVSIFKKLKMYQNCRYVNKDFCIVLSTWKVEGFFSWNGLLFWNPFSGSQQRAELAPQPQASVCKCVGFRSSFMTSGNVIFLRRVNLLKKLFTQLTIYTHVFVGTFTVLTSSHWHWFEFDEFVSMVLLLLPWLRSTCLLIGRISQVG